MELRNKITYDESQIDSIENAVFEHNQKIKENPMGIYYIIDTTGEKKVYWTLYRFNSKCDSPYVNPCVYIKNISADLNKVKDIIDKLIFPIEIYTHNNNSPIISQFQHHKNGGNPYVTFGKYGGKKMNEIWEIDRGWVFWFIKNYNNVSKNGTLLMEQAKELVAIFFDELEKNNRETCTSVFVGQLKDRITLSGKVEKISNDIVYIIGNDGNIYYIYDKNFGLKRDMDIELVGTITNHKEKMGRKTTYLNRVRIIKNETK